MCQFVTIFDTLCHFYVISISFMSLFLYISSTLYLTFLFSSPLDDIIQKTIRREFDSRTVITIAHRINTIMDSTRVLVLRHGKVVEYDTPAALLANQNSEFFGMALEAGLVGADGTLGRARRGEK